jgi:hypothetical protein
VSSGLFRRGALERPTRRNNPEDTILHSHRRENLKFYTILMLYLRNLRGYNFNINNEKI